MHRELLIGGVFFGGPCDGSIGKTQHYAPYDGRLVGTAAEAGWNEVNFALSSAHDAFPLWRRTPTRDRQGLLRRVAAALRDRHEELSQLLSLEIGKPIGQARGEVTRCALTFDLAADALSLPTGQVLPVDLDARGDGYRGEVRRVPRGPVLAIVPYNWPLNLAAHKIAPALAVGNPVVVKAASMGTLSTLTLGRIIHECGAPDGVINVLNCPAALAQKAALDARVPVVSFTGSPAVGWRLKEMLPRKMVTLELGGDASAVVPPDADIDFAVSRLIPAAFGYAGQVCISVQHILVHESRMEEFRAKFVAAAEACPTGDPSQVATVCGPVIRDEDADRIMEWIAEAESGGAQVLCGGSRTARVIEPTVLEDVPRDVRLGCEEVFGPVVTLHPYTSREEAADRINASRFGIHAGVFTRDLAEAAWWGDALEVGGVVIGDAPNLRFDALPYGGVKESGFGREGILSALTEMTEERTIITRIRS